MFAGSTVRGFWTACLWSDLFYEGLTRDNPIHRQYFRPLEVNKIRAREKALMLNVSHFPQDDSWAADFDCIVTSKCFEIVNGELNEFSNLKFV